MSSIKDVLKRLNKNRAELDKIKPAAEHPEDYFKRDYIPTGSPYLDYRIKKELGKGGFIKGAFNMLIGGEGSAKSSIALITAHNCQKEGKYVVYFDGEGSTNESYLQRFCIDKDLFIYHKGRNLEDMLDSAEAFSTTEDVGMIIFDSIPIFTSTIVENKSASDNHMAVEARRWTARFPIIEGNAIRRNICLLGLSFYTMDPGAMGDPRVLKRGAWQKLASNLSIELTKKDIIKDDEKKPIGHKIDVRIKKSKVMEYDAKDVFQINFYYQFGFDKYDEYTSIFIEEGLINQSSAWFDFPSKDGEEIKIQGKASVAAYFKENEEDFNHLLNTLNG